MAPSHNSPVGRWHSLLVLGLTMIIAAAEIGVVSAIFPVLRQALNLTTAHLGVFAGVGLLARTIFGPIWAMMADHYGRKRVLVLAVLVWSAFVASAGFAQGYTQLLVLYSVGVIGAVAAEPIVHSIVSDLFPPGERGRAFGLLRALVGLGVAVRVPVVGWLSGSPEGWRNAFYLLGVLQIVCGILLFAGLAEPRFGQSEPSHGALRTGNRFNFRDLPALWRIPSVRLLAINYVLATSIVMLSYLPTFMTERRGCSVPESTQMFGLMYVGVVIGALFGGALGDWAARRNPSSGRIILMQIYLVAFAIMSVLIFQMEWQAHAMFYILHFAFGVLFPIGFAGCVLPMLSTVILPEMRSTGFGLLASFVQGISLAIISMMVGKFADQHGLPRMLFWAITVPYLLNAVAWSLFYRIYPRDVAAMQHQLEGRP